MIKTYRNRLGFSLVEVIVVVAVVGIIGLLGYVLYNNQVDEATDTNRQGDNQSIFADDVEEAPRIESMDDLEAAEAVLDRTDPTASNGDDTDQLDAELNSFE